MLPSLPLYLSDPSLEEQRVEALSYAHSKLDPKNRRWSVPEDGNTDNPLILELMQMFYQKKDQLKIPTLRVKLEKKLYNMIVLTFSSYND